MSWLNEEKTIFPNNINFTFFSSDSQTINPNQYENNLTKYWIYRERLKSEFMIGIGPSQGQSLPASERIRDRGQGGGALLKWGDGTINLLTQYK